MGVFFYEKPRYGCGSGRFFIKDCFFQEACKIHDIEYWLKQSDRKDIDKRFLNNMLKIAQWKTIRVIQAYIFFIIVRLVWWFFYNHNK